MKNITETVSSSTLCFYLLGYLQKTHTVIWLNGLIFVHELGGCGFESHCSSLVILLFEVSLVVIMQHKMLQDKIKTNKT